MPKIWRAQAVLAHVSGLPKDQVAMTFHFRAVAETAAEAEAVAEQVRDFITLNTAGGSTAIGHYLSNAIPTDNHQVKVYEYDEATGNREPFEGAPPTHVEPFSLLGRLAPASSYPSEVAVCLSYRDVSAGAVPAARRRGRVYVGPLSVDAGALVGGVPRPTAAFQTIVRAAGERLKDQATLAGTPWLVYSRPFAGRGEIVRPGRSTLPALPARPGAGYTVDQVWTDDAFDTQRRRGEAALGRTYGPVD